MGRAEADAPLPSRTPRTRSWAAGAGPVLLLATGVAMLRWTWRAWPDPLIDFGRELYVPWRLSAGEALFTDIAWFNGPLSQHWNGLLFRLFGPGLSVLVWSNLLVLTATTAIAYALVSRVAGRLAATAAGLVFLLVFAFGQYVAIGNYNWVTPYAHEVTHGVALALAAVFALDAAARRGSVRVLGLAGAALGLCFLTKAEPFLAGAAACAVLLLPEIRGRDVRWLGAFVGAASLPVAVSLVLVGWRGTLGAWPIVLAGDVARLPFYVEGAGLADPALRTSEALAWSAMWLVALSPPLALAWLARGTRARAWAPAAGAVALAAFLLLPDAFVWREAVRPLTLLSAVTVAVLAVARWRGPRARRDLLGLALAVFALAMLAKMILNVRTFQYGFVLAMPATLAAVAVLVGWLPARLDARGWRGDVFAACALAALAVFAGRHVQATGTWLDRKTEWVGEGRDAFRADARGALVRRAVDLVRRSDARSLAVLPEGVMINYLARTPAPTPYVTFMPPEEVLFGDAAWTEAFRTSPPDLVLLVPRAAWEYGREPWGAGFGRALSRWIGGEYVDAGTISAPGAPFEISVRAPPS